MKNKLFALFGAAIFFVCSLSFSVAAEEAYSESATTQTYYSLVSYARMKRGQSPLYVLDNKGNANCNTDTVGEVKNLADGILASKKAKNSVENWINTSLTKNCASGSEWYVIALSQNGKYDFSAYQNALVNYLENNMPGPVQTAQKLALALIATGKRDGVVQNIADRPITNTDSIMAYVYGLHLYNNGIISKTNSADSIKSTLLNMQRSDGGWAIAGQKGDVDVTAMVLQALAPCCNETRIKPAVDRGVAFLSSRQNANGTFSTLGKENCESTVQVITALSDLKIDCNTDARFSKNGNTPLDALKLFRLSGGGFSHLINVNSATATANHKTTTTGAGSSDDTSAPDKSSQTDSKGKDKNNASSSEKELSEGGANSEASQNTENGKTAKITAKTAGENRVKSKKKRIGYKPVVIIICLIVSAGTAFLLRLKKKANLKNMILLFGVLAGSVLFIIFTNFESASEHNKVPLKNNPVGTVTISIRCDNIVGKSDSKNIPKDGCILSDTEIQIEKGETVYDVLNYAVKQKAIHMEKKGDNGFVYVSAINNIYEFQFGDMSGWVYHVNGESPFVGCGNYKVKPGDKIEWMYTLDLGVDTGNSFDSLGGGGS